MARILIAGCGDVGGALGRLLVDAGHTVWGLRRRPDALPPGLRPIAADLTDAASLKGLPDGLDAVFYTAAATGRDENHYRRAYVDGPTRLLAALHDSGQRPRRVLFTSSTAVYAQNDGGWVDEDSPAAAQGFAGRLLRQGEAAVLDGPFPATVIRFAGIYGPRRTRLIDSLRAGTAACAPGRYTNRIHRDDAAAALAHLLDLDAPAPLYLGVDDTPALHCEVLDWLARQLGVAPPRLDEGAARAGSKRCSNARLRAGGFRPRYPGYRQGYAALLAQPSPGLLG